MNFSGPLEDRILIRELCEQYCDGVMSRDLKVWSDVWAADAVWVLPDTTRTGREAIVQGYEAITATFTQGVFFGNLARTHVSGDRAHGRCHHFEAFDFPGAGGWFVTYYDDEYVKANGRWYIQKRVLTSRLRGKF